MKINLRVKILKFSVLTVAFHGVFENLFLCRISAKLRITSTINKYICKDRCAMYIAHRFLSNKYVVILKIAGSSVIIVLFELQLSALKLNTVPVIRVKMPQNDTSPSQQRLIST